MILRLRLTDFRSYPQLNLGCDPLRNVLVGPNGAGKTNVLEAIYLLAVARSPRTARDIDLVRRGADSYTVAAEVAEEGHSREIAVTYRPQGGKVWSVDGRSLRRGSVPYGTLSVVFFSPDDLWLVKGGPAGRRAMLDRVLVQVRPLHADALSKYDDALAQRNFLLRDIRARRAGAAMLDVWEEQLVEHGMVVTRRRAALARQLGITAAEIHGRLAPGEKLSCEYVSGIDGEHVTDEAALRQRYRDAFAAARPQELERGFTQVGPHRDDWNIMVNGLPLRGFGSQGQQRTAVLSLKLAERDALCAIRGRPPVLLLDDVLSELDQGRRAAISQTLAEEGQAFLTTTDAEEIVGPGLHFRVTDGRVTAATDR